MDFGILEVMPKDFPKLLLSIGLCLGVGMIGSFFTVSSIPTWYATLNKPFFSPPNWVFAPVWTTLYILMGISLYLVWIREKIPMVFWIQLIFNGLWSLIFFGMKNPGLALVDIIALEVSIFLTIKTFLKISKPAGRLLFPYLAWVSFASILNLSIVLLN